MRGRTISVIKSPYPIDSNLPWTYSGRAFKDWVYEVLTDCGKFGHYPRNVDEAIDIAMTAGFEIKEVCT